MPIWTAVSAIAAALAVIVAAIYTRVTYRLFLVTDEPKVILFVRHDRERPTLLTIVIENIGRSIAEDVKFIPSRPVPKNAYGIETAVSGDAQHMTNGPLVTGIPALGPGDRRVLNWGQYGGLSSALEAGPIRVDIAYRHGRRHLRGVAHLDVESYADTDASEPPQVIVANSSKKAASSLDRIANALIDIRNEIRTGTQSSGSSERE